MQRIRIAGALLAGGLALAAAAPAAAQEIGLIMDGQRVNASPPPRIEQGRTLVPLRGVFERLGATVTWDGETRTVTVEHPARQLTLAIDSRLVCFGADCDDPALVDVPPRIFSDRTFIPLRFVATALGADVHWDAATRTVSIAKGDGAPAQTTPDVTLASPRAGAQITGRTELRLQLSDGARERVRSVRVLLVDPKTGRGPLVAQGSAGQSTLTWLPDPAYDGDRWLVVIGYDGQRQVVDGDVIPVRVAVQPQVAMEGVSSGQTLSGRVELSPQLNFVATKVTLEVLDAAGNVVRSLDGDPAGTITWTPRVSDNGSRSLRLIAHDRLGRTHRGPTVPVTIAVAPSVSISGVSDQATIRRPVTLSASANFEVAQIRIRWQPDGGSATTIATLDGAGSYRWLPAPGLNGSGRVWAEAVTADGQSHSSSPRRVTIDVAPSIFIETVGPNQVLNGEVSLRSLSNVDLTSVSYQLIHPNGSVQTIATTDRADKAVTWRPQSGDDGQRSLRVRATTASGATITSEAIPVRVYSGRTYSSQPIIEQPKFIDFASRLARPSRERTGMSAALQVAQAILETGWGQYVPVDKYSGKLSNNLFGIKGSGPAGSVISNTWEEANGVTYRIDANFRAYHNVQQSWDDHKALLLNAARYEPFRAVMHDGTQGAWALRRAGYATDSQYAIKLIDIMTRYNLYELDEHTP